MLGAIMAILSLLNELNNDIIQRTMHGFYEKSEYPTKKKIKYCLTKI